jgi:hypothetical protein
MEHTSIKMNHLKCTCLLYKIKYFSPPVSVHSYAIFMDVPLNCFTQRNYRAVGSLVFISVKNTDVKTRGSLEVAMHLHYVPHAKVNTYVSCLLGLFPRDVKCVVHYSQLHKLSSAPL